MSAHLLDFERPLADLEQKLRELRRFEDEDGTVDLTEQISALEVRVDTLRQSIYRGLTRWQRVQLARHPERPYTLDYVGELTTGFQELHGDRLFGDDRALVGGLATFRARASARATARSWCWATRKGATPSSGATAASGCPTPRATARPSA